MVHCPEPMARTKPERLTVATAGSLVCQLIFLLVPVHFNVYVSPLNSVILYAFSFKPVFVITELLFAKLQLAGCDITRSAVAKIEVGQRHIYPDEILHIRRILHTTYEELFEKQYD